MIAGSASAAKHASPDSLFISAFHALLVLASSGVNSFFFLLGSTKGQGGREYCFG
jgi:hypothetical protein